MNAAILLVAALATSDAPAPPVDASFDDDASALQGTWEVVDLIMDGKVFSPASKGEHWTFQGDEVERDGRKSWRVVAGAGRLDRIDLDDPCPGHYAITGDRLVWTLDNGLSTKVWTFRRVAR